MRRRGGSVKLYIAILAVAICSTACVGQETKTLPKFIPAPVDGGVIRSWGNDAMGGVMAAWEEAFHKYHPDITFQSSLYGSGTGMAGIITGVSDLSLMGRPATANEIMGFEWVFRYKPLGFQVMTGSMSAEGKTPALSVFVSRRNPVTQISMAQLAAILGCPDKAGTPDPPTWGMVGVRGAWARKTIHAYIYDSETGTGAFLQQALLGTGDRWHWSRVTEFRDRIRPDGTVYAAGQQVIDALLKDPNGIAVSTLAYAVPAVKALALSNGKDAVMASRKTLTDRTYPLARGVYIYVNRNPGKPVEARVKEFLRFIMSEEGQDLVQRQGDYLQLDLKTDLEQLQKLQ